MCAIEKQFVIGVEDLRFVSLRCPHCNTRVILDLAIDFKPNRARAEFTPRVCAGCGVPFDTALHHIDALHRVYREIARLQGVVTFVVDSGREDSPPRV